MFEHNHENGKDNMNNAQNQGFNETPLDQEPVYNSYSAGRSVPSSPRPPWQQEKSAH